MALQLLITLPGASPQRLALGPGRTRVPARPGAQYRVLDDAGQVPPGVTIKRLENAIVVEGLPDGRSLEIGDFFSACGPEGATTCQISTAELGGSGGPITPSSDPIGALPDGSFLLYGSTSTGGQIVAPPVITGADNAWKAIGAGVGGLALAGLAAGAGGGGGGGSAADTTAPPPPTLTGKAVQNSGTPTFTGTGEPGSIVLVRIDLNGNGVAGDGTDPSFQTTVGTDGTWTLNLAGATPVTGTWGGSLPDAASYVLSAVSRDAAGNVSGLTSGAVAIDTRAPAAPVVDAIAGDGVVSGAEAATGVTVSGTGEAGAAVRLSWGNTVKTGTVGADGRWSVLITAAEIPSQQGSSTIEAVLTDAAGNVGAAGQQLVVIDTSPPAAPTLSITVASDSGAVGDNITNVVAPMIRVSFNGNDATAPAVGDVVRLAVDGALVGTTALTSTQINAGFAEIATPTLTAGDRIVSATITDAVGNASAAATLTVRIDTSSPAVLVPTLTAASNSGSTADLITNDATPTIRVNFTGTGAAAPAVGDTVSLTVSGTQVGTATVTGVHISNGYVDITTSALATGTSPVIAATLTSIAGNTSTAANLQLTIDTTAPAAPTVTLTAGSDSGTVGDGITNDPTPTVRVALNGAAATAPVAGDVVRLTVAGVQVGTATLTPADITADFVDVTTTTLTAGSRTIDATVTDAAGNVSATGSLGLTISTAVPGTPVPTLTAASNSGSTADLITNDATPTIRVSFTGASAGDVVGLSVAGSSVGSATLTGADVTAGFVDVTTTTLADGTRTVSATVTTIAGNASAAGTLALTIDTTAPAAPTVTLTAGSDSGTVGDGITNDTTPTVRVALNGAAATAPVAGDVVLLTVAGVQVGTATLTPADITADFVDVTTTTLTAGSRTIDATVTDAAGNVSATGSLGLTIDTAVPGAPVPTLTAASNSGSTADLVTNDATPTIRVSFTGAAAGDVVLLSVAGTQVGTATLIAGDVTNGFVDITTSALVDGLRTVSATITNGSGNVSPAGTVGLTIDTTLPATPSLGLNASSDSGTQGDFTTTDTTPSLRVTLNGAGATAPVAGDVITLRVSGTAVGTATLSAGDITNDYVDITTSAIAPGAVTVTATVTDIAGNASTAGTLGLTISADATAPLAPTLVLAPSSDSGVTGDSITTDGTPTIRINFNGTGATAPAAGDVVTLTLGGTQIGTATLVAGDITNDYVEITSTAQLDGVRTYSATVTDVVGNVSGAGSVAVTIDRTVATAPAFSFKLENDALVAYTDINGPPGAAPANPDTTPTLTFNLGALLATGETLVVNRSNLAGTSNVDVLTLTSASAVGDTVVPTPTALAADVYIYTGTFTDAAGNSVLLDIDGAGSDGVFTIKVA